jgi:hypothetical protein
MRANVRTTCGSPVSGNSTLALAHRSMTRAIRWLALAVCIGLLGGCAIEPGDDIDEPSATSQAAPLDRETCAERAERIRLRAAKAMEVDPLVALARDRGEWTERDDEKARVSLATTGVVFIDICAESWVLRRQLCERTSRELYDNHYTSSVLRRRPQWLFYQACRDEFWF